MIYSVNWTIQFNENISWPRVYFLCFGMYSVHIVIQGIRRLV